jgi:hypothetical protein
MVAGLGLVAAFGSATAQGSGRLYDPEPPVDSAYVRTLVATKGAPVDVFVDGKLRLRSVPGQEVSDYMVIPEGKHTLALHAAGKTQAIVSKELDVVKGKSNTVAFASLKGDAQTSVFEDRGNTNKLKATLAAYHVAPALGNVDISTADGASKVFGGLLPGSSASIQVNPIAVSLLVKAAKKTSTVKLEMSQGGTYSVVVFDEGQGRPIIKVFTNRVERYSGP